MSTNPATSEANLERVYAAGMAAGRREILEQLAKTWAVRFSATSDTLNNTPLLNNDNDEPAGFSPEDAANLSQYFASSDDGYLPGSLHRRFGCTVRQFSEATGHVQKAVNQDGRWSFVWAMPGRGDLSEVFSEDFASFADRADGEQWETSGRWYKREGGKTRRIANPGKAEKDKDKADAAAKKKADRDAKVEAKTKADSEAKAKEDKSREDAAFIVNKVLLGHAITSDDAKAFNDHLSQLKTPDIVKMQKALEARGGVRKTDKIAKLVEWAKAKAKEAKAEPSQPAAAPSTEQAKPSHPALQAMHDAIAKTPGLTAQHKKEYSAATKAVFERIPAHMHDLFTQQLAGGSHFYPDNKSVTAGCIDYTAKLPGLGDAVYAKLAQMRGDAEAGNINFAGAYVRAAGGSLHLDGSLKKGALGGKHGNADSAQQTYAHEFAHVLDGPENKLSRSEAWDDAYNYEIGPKSGAANLSKYAHTNAGEGFAEFGRLVYGGSVPLEQVEKEFPAATKFFKDNKLWPEASK